MAKTYTIRKNEQKLKNGTVIKSYIVTLKHPDTKKFLTMNFSKKSDAEKWAKMMSKIAKMGKL